MDVSSVKSSIILRTAGLFLWLLTPIYIFKAFWMDAVSSMQSMVSCAVCRRRQEKCNSNVVDVCSFVTMWIANTKLIYLNLTIVIGIYNSESCIATYILDVLCTWNHILHAWQCIQSESFWQVSASFCGDTVWMQYWFYIRNWFISSGNYYWSTAYVGFYLQLCLNHLPKTNETEKPINWWARLTHEQ